MKYLVKCKDTASQILLPPGVELGVGASYRCPSSCPNKNGRCKDRDTFVITKVMKLPDEKKPLALTYDTESVNTAAPSAPRSVPSAPPSPAPDVSPVSAPVSNGNPFNASAQQNPFNASASNPFSASASNPFSVSAKQNPFNSGEKPFNSGAARRDDDVLEIDPTITEFVIPAFVPRRFTVTPQPPPRRTYPLKQAVDEIFKYWDTALVFEDEGTLRKEFIWLMANVLKGQRVKSRVDEIMRDGDRSISQKFFMLFYDVLYKRDPPVGFFWCDAKLSYDALTPVFTDKRDFMKRFCGEGPSAAEFRNFYKARKDEILYFFHTTEDELLGGMTVETVRDTGEIVYIDRKSDFKPVHLGRIYEFADNMQHPSSGKQMKFMCDFLDKFRVSATSVILRDDNPTRRFEHVGESYGEEKRNDVFVAAGLTYSSTYATDYDYYCSLLKEYVKVFKPERLCVGDLCVTLNDFFKDVYDIVKNYCKVLFVGDPNPELKAKYIGRALLLDSLYSRGILDPFVNRCENTELPELFALIKKPTPERYVALVDTPVFVMQSNEEVSLDSYIADAVSKQSAPSLCGFLKKDKLVAAFFEGKSAGTGELKKLCEEYDKQFSEFNGR